MQETYYCPFCQRNISPAEDDDGNVISFPDGGVIYVHDDVPHDEDFNFGVLQ